MIKPLYVARRIGYKLYERRHPHEPWIAQGAVAFLGSALCSTDQGLEWGSGRSTQWFAARLGHLTSIEFDATWYHAVREKIVHLPNVDLRFIDLDHEPTEPAVPRYERLPRYVDVVNEFATCSLDFVLVDGHYRQACVLAVLPKVAIGGLLAIDNTDWLPEAEWGIPPDWPLVHRSRNIMTETSIWRKPATNS